MKKFIKQKSNKLMSFLNEEEGKNTKSNLIKAGVVFTVLSAAAASKTAYAQACPCIITYCMGDCSVLNSKFYNDSGSHTGYHMSGY
jgi:hypothetical protein